MQRTHRVIEPSCRIGVFWLHSVEEMSKATVKSVGTAATQTAQTEAKSIL